MKWLTKTRIAVAVVIGLLIVSVLGVDIIKKQHEQRDTNGGSKVEKAVANNVQQAGGITVPGVITPESGGLERLVPSVKGEVIEVLVKSDQDVKKGELLLRMDPRHAQIKVDEAEAGVKNAQALLDKAKRGMKEWELGCDLLRIKVANVNKEYKRAYNYMKKQEQLAKDKTFGTSQDEYTDSIIQAERAKLSIDAAQKELDLLELKKPDAEARQAEAAVQLAEAQRKEAKFGLELCELRAPKDGTIVRSLVSVGTKFGEQGVMPAFFFYTGPLVVTAELNQEWAHKVKEGMTATITDAGASGQSWKGRVYYIARSYLPKRESGTSIESVNPFAQSQELVLECRIALDSDQTAPAPSLNQKVRVHIGQ